jgi:hypothetical protein
MLYYCCSCLSDRWYIQQSSIEREREGGQEQQTAGKVHGHNPLRKGGFELNPVSQVN